MFDFYSFWHAHAPIISILIPAFTGFILVLLGNPGSGSLKQDWRQPWRRGISLSSAILGLITAISYLSIANTGQITGYLVHVSENNRPMRNYIFGMSPPLFVFTK